METNIGKDERTELFKIYGYKSFHNEKIQGKSKGTGAALYIDETLNAIENEKLCLISPDIESLFVTVNDSNKKINIGTIYRSPSGDEEKFLEDFLSLIEQFPKNTTSIIMGDFNFDLFKRLQSVVGKFEDIFLSQGLYPLISLPTHKTNSSSSCIDNIFTNAIEKYCLSGIIDDIGLHHSPIFSIFNLS